MKKTVKLMFVLMICTVLQSNALAAKKKVTFDADITLDVSHLDITPLEIKASAIRTLIEYNWEITGHTAANLEASYKGKYHVLLTINNQSLTIVRVRNGKLRPEVRSSMTSKWKQWFKSLENRFSRETLYRHNYKLAAKMLEN